MILISFSFFCDNYGIWTGKIGLKKHSSDSIRFPKKDFVLCIYHTSGGRKILR